MVTKNELTAGSDVESRCLKCKQITNHIIVAMVGEKVAKVQCNVCGGRHNYRPAEPAGTACVPKTAKKGKGQATGGRSARQTKAAADHFAEMVAGRDPALAKAYAVTATFKQGDLLDHAFFGLGLVVATTQPNKIEVIFREGGKILICVLEKPK